MGQLALARSAKVHALRAATLAWFALSAALALILAMPWFDFLVPFGPVVAILVAMVVAATVVAALPLERFGDAIVDELRAEEAGGRLRNIAGELSIALGERAENVVIHESSVPNVGAFPTSTGVVVMATSQAVEQLRRDELEALVAAQFAGMRDRWCRIATRAELVWTLTKALAFASILVAKPVAFFVGVVMLMVPRTVEATRDLCADVAAVMATRHPAALAGGLRHLAPSAAAGRAQRLVTRWYLPVNPFLVLPKRQQSMTSIGNESGPGRTWTDIDEVTLELVLRADRAEALASGADPRDYTGREYWRRWNRLGTDPTKGPFA